MSRCFDGHMSCVHSDLNDRLPPFALQALGNLEPAPRAPAAAQREAREAQHKWLQEHMTECFTAESTCSCL
eukprot:6510661-Alexandrium_andersonii.AAC.1